MAGLLKRELISYDENSQRFKTTQKGLLLNVRLLLRPENVQTVFGKKIVAPGLMLQRIASIVMINNNTWLLLILGILELSTKEKVNCSTANESCTPIEP